MRQCDATMAKTANKLPLAASCQLWQLPVAATRSVHMRRRAQCAAVSIRSCDRYLTFFGDQLTLHAARGGSCSGGTTHNSCALYLSQSYALRSCADMDSGIMPQTEWGMPAQAGSSSRNGFQGTPTASQVSCWCCSAAAGVVAGAEAAAGVGCCNCHCRCLSFALANQDLSPAHTTRRGAAFTWLLSGWRCLLDCYLHFGIE